jgi:hypothetical protein
MKVLLAPRHPRDSFIVGVDGSLRVIDPPRCLGYASCCVCPECRDRETLQRQRDVARVNAVKQPWETEAA